MRLFERQFLRPIYAAIQDQIRPVLEVLQHSGIQQAINSLDKLVINHSVSSVLIDMYEVIGLYQAKKLLHEIRQEIKGFGIDEVLIQLIISYYKAKLLQTVIDISDTTKARILELLISADTQGLGVDQIAAQLMGDEFTLWRARLIVRTESVKAYNYGMMAAQSESEWELEKTWSAAHDGRTRESHVIIDGTTVDENEKFRVPIFKKIGRANIPIGIDYMSGPGDDTASAGNLCNCRCAMFFRPKRNENGRLIRKTNKSLALQ